MISDLIYKAETSFTTKQSTEIFFLFNFSNNSNFQRLYCKVYFFTFS